MKDQELFTSIVLHGGLVCEIKNAKGIHYFNALTRAKGDTVNLIKHLIIELCEIGGEQLKEIDIEEMPIADVTALSEIIGAMLTPKFN